MKAEIIKFIRDNIDFKSGVFQAVDGEKRLIDVAWKHNVHYIVDCFNGILWDYVTRNGEQVSLQGTTTKKPDEEWLKYTQKLVNQIENGDFNHKKTRSDEIAEIIQKRNLTSYMNNTKWREFVHAMDEEMSVAVPYDLKTLFEDSHDEYFDTFYDYESFNYYDFKSIEWVKVKPVFSEYKFRGMLIPDEEIAFDVEDEFIMLMKKYSIPYEYDVENKVYIIYGYKGS
ncbi:MAG: hypothetical protein K2N27_10370 [Ruminococcus sp.]|nr:hypothetical protein [Ruminococcus sp.]